MTKTELAKRMKELGLNEYEAKTYLALVETGKTSSGKIAAKSGVPYGRIYDILESLVRRGMIVIAPEKPKKWYAHPPNAILGKIIDEKKRDLDTLKEEIKSLQKKHELLPKEVVYIVRGKENFHKIVKEKTPKKYNYRIKWDFLFHPMWARNDRILIKKGVAVKTMGPLNGVTKDRIEKWLKFDKPIKEFPNEGCPIGIVDDYVFIGLIDKDTAVMIHHAGFAEIMKNLFLDSWKIRESIKL